MESSPVTLFERVPIFAGLDPEAIELLADAAINITFQTGDRIVDEGSPGNTVFIIESGSVQVIKALGAPGETELARLAERDFFGEMSIIECQPRSASIRAAEPTCVHRLAASDLHHLFLQAPDQYAILILNIARDLARRLRRLGDLFAARGQRGMEVRLSEVASDPETKALRPD